MLWAELWHALLFLQSNRPLALESVSSLTGPVAGVCLVQCPAHRECPMSPGLIKRAPSGRQLINVC